MPFPAPSILESIAAWAVPNGDGAEDFPARGAVVFLDADGVLTRLSYAEMWQAVQQRARLLATLLPASRVGLIAPQGPAFLVDALAILAAGHCLVPINGDLAEEDRNDLTARAGIHALFRSGADDPENFPGQPIDLADDGDYRKIAPAYLRFTSGSTGARKGVLLGHRTILERTTAANARMRIGPQDRVLCLLPMVDHFVVSILLYLRFGATVLVAERNEDAPPLAIREKATVIYGSPTHFRAFADPLPTLRLAVSTTEGLSAKTAADFFGKTGHPLTQALGIIEAGLLTLNDRCAAAEPLLAGHPMPDYQISILANDGLTGEVHVAGPGLLDAYVAPWRPRSALLGPPGFPTGDHGWMDATGCLHLSGRGKNRLWLNGVPLFSEEVEAIIQQHPEVTECLVFSREDRIVVQVVGQGNAALTAWIREKLPACGAAPEIQFVDRLRKTATGKIARPLPVGWVS